MSSEYGTYETVWARCWPWRSGKAWSCSLFDRNRTRERTSPKGEVSTPGELPRKLPSSCGGAHVSCCRANEAHRRQSRRNYGSGFQVKVLKACHVVASSLRGVLCQYQHDCHVCRGRRQELLRRAACRHTLHPAPCSLPPSPYTLTLYPTPYTLHPTSYTLHPIPYTLYPPPVTVDRNTLARLLTEPQLLCRNWGGSQAGSY